jgi:hypothetical protein
MTTGKKHDFYFNICKIFIEFSQYIANNKIEIDQQTKGNAVFIFNFASNAFSNIKKFIDNTLEPLETIETKKTEW